MGSSTILLTKMLPNWIVRIKESSSNGRWQEVISYYLEMRRSGVRIMDDSVFPPILKACPFLSSRHGITLHACLIKEGFESFTSITNSIMSFYVKCGNLENAASVFDSMKSRDSVSWNILIHGYLEHGNLREGLWWFSRARISGFEPNSSTLVLAIHACRSLKAEREGRKLHAYVIQSGFSAIASVQNSLLSMYADAEMGIARKLFEEMHEKDVISWSVMISGYVQSKEPQIGLHMFREMIPEPGIEPDGVIMVSILKACANLLDINLGRLLHGLVICRGLDHDLFVENSLIDMYAKCHDSCSAFKVFSEMSQRNIVSWNCMLSGFVLNGNYLEALSLICSMREEEVDVDEVTLVNILQMCRFLVHPFQCKSVHCVIIRREFDLNELVLNSLVDAYAKCSLVELAWEVFVRMRKRDVVSWSTMIAGFAHCGKPVEAIAIFKEMIEAKETPNIITMINALEACSVSADLKMSKWVHGVAIRRYFAGEVAVGTAIVNMYSKCGDIVAARNIFDQIPEKNTVTWSAMIAAYGMNCLAHEAFALTAEMKLSGLKPNAVTTLSLLAACSHCGLVEEGLAFFKSMVQDYGVRPKPEHYSCMVDMLCRAGNLDGAMELIKMMPENMKGHASIWGAMLSACRSYGNTRLGEGAVSQVLELEPLKHAGYVLASNMYAADGLWDNVATIRGLARKRGVKVVSGYSLVHINNKACRFVAGDMIHRQESSKLQSLVQELHYCMKIDEMKYYLPE